MVLHEAKACNRCHSKANSDITPSLLNWTSFPFLFET